MKIIPVIDIKDGLVVSAKQGNRRYYSPIQSTICSSSSIDSVISGLLSVFSFDTFYIADLNAIMREGNNSLIIKKTIAKYSELSIWVDNGSSYQYMLTLNDFSFRGIVGSESQKIMMRQVIANHMILSLDFDVNKNFMGIDELMVNSQLWPKDIIIMTLGKVGSNTGPDLDRLSYFYKKYPNKNFIAAGGVRNIDDLWVLRTLGVTQVLVSSVLHSGSISGQAIKKLISAT